MKDAYWFKHDSNARNDEKIIDLLGDLGYEGYGIFWALVEYLRDNEGYEAEYKPKRLGLALRADQDLIQQVIEGYGLFQFQESGRFYSNSLKSRMKELDKKREQQRQNANKRWHSSRENNKDPSDESHGNATAFPNQSNKNIEERKRGEKTKTEEKTPDERVQGEKGELFFFNECLKVRNAYPVILFFEYTYFVCSNKKNTVQEYRSNFIEYWKNSRIQTDENDIKRRLAAMAKIGFGLSSDDTKNQLTLYLENQNDGKSEEDYYKGFLEQLKDGGFEPVESLKTLAGKWLKL